MSDDYAHGRRDGLRLALGILVLDEAKWPLYAEVNPDYTHRPEPDSMLPALRQAASVAAWPAEPGRTVGPGFSDHAPASQ